MSAPEVMQSGSVSVAYFTMEVAIDDRLPSFSGGLGVLAGDHLRSAADAGYPLAAVTLLYHGGYFRQTVSTDGEQTEAAVDWAPEQHLERLEARVRVRLEDRDVVVGVWRLHVDGVRGGRIPVYFLDTKLPENAPADREICERLYHGDVAARLRQEVVLGIGGVAMLDALGHAGVGTFHMNEGHSALLGLALLRREAAHRGRTKVEAADLAAVRGRCVF
ncbi:MAG TPA: alpha-glucan family phosphorylase, partial [Acidimicrobiales bacterium]|nr:alpha-glucan family phosphorylase [Acidimicrobiales bacterium]